jgi:hypothetical protein
LTRRPTRLCGPFNPHARRLAQRRLLVRPSGALGQDTPIREIAAYRDPIGLPERGPFLHDGGPWLALAWRPAEPAAH